MELIHVHLTSGHRIHLLHYELTRPGDTVQSAAQFFKMLSDIAARSGSGNQDTSFWSNLFDTLIQAGFNVVQFVFNLTSVLPCRGQWFPGKHEPLIDLTTWNRVQALLGGHVYHAHELTSAAVKAFTTITAVPVTTRKIIHAFFDLTFAGDRTATISLALDIYTWLAYRLCRIDNQNGVMLCWDNLRDQFGQEYRTSKDFKHEFRSVLRQVLLVYPSA